MTTTKLKKRIDAVIKVDGRCKISNERLWVFKKRAVPLLMKAMNETYKHFPIDTHMLARRFSDYYFTRDLLCSVLEQPNDITDPQVAETRENLVKRGVNFDNKKALKLGIVAQQFPLKTIINEKGVSPTKLSCYHPDTKNLDIVIKSIKHLPMPSAMFSVPLDSDTAQRIFSKPENSPAYVKHVKMKSQNPIVIRKKKMIVSTHRIPAVIATIEYSIRTFVRKNFTRWTLYFTNKLRRKDPDLGISNDGSLGFNFGSTVYIGINVLRMSPGNQNAFETHTIIIVSNATRHKSGTLQWLAGLAYSKIVGGFNAAAYARKLYALEHAQRMIAQKKRIANGTNLIKLKKDPKKRKL